MRTAIDTNILSALWSNESSASRIAHQLGAAKTEGALLISPAVYAELLAYPGASEAFVNRFLDETAISIDFHLQEEVWREAGRRFAQYASRRRRSGSGGAKWPLADFLVGAHALVQADRLITLDPVRYEQDFPELKLLQA